jgi:threonine/homoserine/homoserine lactone efflux protein
MELFSFIAALSMLLVTPGPTNTLLATAGASLNLRRALLLLPAETTAYTISIVTLLFLVGPILRTSPKLGTMVQLLCAAYLCYCAWKLSRSKEALYHLR